MKRDRLNDNKNIPLPEQFKKPIADSDCLFGILKFFLQ
jgi:hypothetical protein